MKISLNIITMQHRGLVTTTVKACIGYFDIIRIVDGGSTDGTVEAIKKLGCEVYINKWNDDVAAQYNFLLKKCNNNEWALFIDDDELPSAYFLHGFIEEIIHAEEKQATHIEVPLMPIQNDIPQNNAVEFMQQVLGENFGDSLKFYMRRFLKIAPDMQFIGITHCGVPDDNLTNPHKIKYPIYHIKKQDGWLMGDIWPVFINPKGHEVDVDTGRKLRQLCQQNGIIHSRDIIPRFKKGNITTSLKKFLWKHKWPDGALAHWWMIYFLKYHPEELPDDFCFVGDITSRRYLSYMVGHAGNLFVKRMEIHPIIKRYLLDNGIEMWSDDVEREFAQYTLSKWKKIAQTRKII